MYKLHRAIGELEMVIRHGALSGDVFLGKGVDFGSTGPEISDALRVHLLPYLLPEASKFSKTEKAEKVRSYFNKYHLLLNQANTTEEVIKVVEKATIELKELINSINS